MHSQSQTPNDSADVLLGRVATGRKRGKSDPQQVLKYLTRYMTGGPISDRRIESDENGMVTFLARSKSKGGKPRRIELRGAEFVRRWSLHILPKSFTRSRACGGFHGHNREKYLATCRQLLGQTNPASEPDSTPTPQHAAAEGPTCPKCDIEMECIGRMPRPSWKDILYREQPGSAVDSPPTGRLSSTPSSRSSSARVPLAHSQLPRPDE